DAIVPFTHFALLADEYTHTHGVKVEDLALVAVKNHRNAAKNPYAQRRKERSLEEILAGKAIAGPFTPLQCTPIGEGAAAVLVASEEGLRRHGIDPARAVRVTASAARSQRLYENATSFDASLTEETTARALGQAGIGPADLDLVELHDAFTIEELEYVERMGLCAPGQALARLKEGV